MVVPMGPVRTNIRGAEPAEMGELQALYRRSSMVWDSDRALMVAHPELVEPDLETIEGQRVRVAVQNGRLVGFSTVLPAPGDAGELDALFVEPDAMRSGIGRMLVEDAVVTCRVLGWSRLEVTANPNAVGFYERVGFVKTGTARTQFADADRMVLDLG